MGTTQPPDDGQGKSTPPSKFGRGRPKDGELRPPKLPPLGRRGRPTKKEAAKRKREAKRLAKEHAAELARREAERLAKAAEEAKFALEQRERLKAIGADMPADPLAAAGKLCNMLIATAEQVLLDPNVPPAAQRAEIRAIARSVQALIPSSRLYQAEQVVRGALSRMDEPMQAPKAKPLVNRPGAPGPIQGPPGRG